MKTIKVLAIFFPVLCVSASAQTLAFSEEEQAIVENRKQEIIKPVSYLSDDFFYELKTEFHIDYSKKDSIKNLCYNREMRKYICNYSIADLGERVMKKKQIDEIYWDSIYTILLPSNPNRTGKATGFALKLADDLNVANEDKNLLMDYALDFARRLRSNPCVNFAREEIDKLKKVLDNKQLKRVLNEKNSEEAYLRATILWKSIVAAHLDEGQDSASQVQIAFRYYIWDLYVHDYYVEQPELLQANLTDLHNHKPEIIKRYEGIGKKETILRKREKKVGQEFAW